MAAPNHVLALLKDLGKKTKQSLDYSGFWQIETALQDFRDQEGGELVSQRYLYDNAYRAVTKALKTGKENIRLSKAKLDTIARYLGYDTFLDYVASLDSAKISQTGPSQVVDQNTWTRYLGFWYSIVKDHTQEADLLISPVQIMIRQDKPMMTMRGPTRVYDGELFIVNGCLCALLDSDFDKHINLIFRVGSFMKPEVLEGVFSSVASSGHPLAGREVLVRVPNANHMDELVNEKMELEEINKLPAGIPDVVLKYFQQYEDNILKIPFPNSFGPRDLDR